MGCRLGDMAGLSFFFLAPFFGILAIVATEEGFRLFRSLRSYPSPTRSPLSAYALFWVSAYALL